MPESRSDDVPLTSPYVGQPDTESFAASPLGQTNDASNRPAPAQPVAEGTAPAVPGYEVLGRLGRGGMGVVYQARHLALQRLVALKMILAGGEAGADEQLRFQREAEAAARIHHPGVIQVYEVGDCDGKPFLALEYCPGGSLARRLDGTPLPPRRAAALAEQLARAVAAAHQADIVHRDLKPANVLLAEDGQPKIADFGLAKLLDGDSAQTQSGAVLGTPSYMAPEQAGGQSRQVGPAADVYALGAILYELLTGRPPFKGATLLETLEQVRAQEPVAPRQLQPKVPRDLETICLKCLQKEPHKRYATAAGLADDLHCFQAGEPIQARPVGRLERAAKWARRKPALAGLLAVLVVSVASVLLLLETARREADRNAEVERGLRRVADDKKQEAEEATKKANRATQQANSEKQVAEQQRDRAELAKYATQLMLAQREGESGNPGRALDVLEGCRWDLRGWEWRHLRRRWANQVEPALTLSAGVSTACYSPDGRRLATSGYDNHIRLWDANTGAKVSSFRAHDTSMQGLAFSPDGRWLASAGAHRAGPRLTREIKVWGSADGRIVRTLGGHRYEVHTLCFSPDGHWLASAAGQSGSPGELGLWDMRSGKGGVRTAVPRPYGLTSLAFSPDGQRLAGATRKGIKLWDPKTGEPLPGLRGPALEALSVSFSPDGRWLAACGLQRERGASKGVIKSWDARTGEPQWDLSSGWDSTVHKVCFSPDGRHLAGLSSLTGITVWDARSGAEVHSFRRYRSGLGGMCYRPDGRHIATWDPRMHVWDVSNHGERVLALGQVGALRFSPDGSRLTGTGMDGRPRRWDMRRGWEVAAPVLPEPRFLSTSASADDGRLAVLRPDLTVKVWDTHTNKLLLALPKQDFCNLVALSPDGHVLATLQRGGAGGEGLERPGVMKLRQVSGGRLLHTRASPGGAFGLVCFSPDGRFLATASHRIDMGDFHTLLSCEVQLWDVRTGDKRWSLPFGKVHIRQLSFSRDGKLLATAGGVGTYQPGLVRVWDVDTGKQRLTLEDFTTWVEGVCFSPDGRRLATGSATRDAQKRAAAGGEIKLWDVASGQLILTLRGPGRGVHSLCFRPDGRLLASAGWDNSVRLWHGGDAWQASLLSHTPNDVKRVGFSPDGKRLVVQILPKPVGSKFGPSQMPGLEVHAWDTRTGKEVVPCTDPAPDPALTATSPDGALTAVTDDSVVRVYRRAEHTPAERARRADEDQGAVINWHEQQAAAAEKAKEWFAARFHLDRLIAARPDDPALKARRAAVLTAQQRATRPKP